MCKGKTAEERQDRLINLLDLQLFRYFEEHIFFSTLYLFYRSGSNQVLNSFEDLVHKLFWCRGSSGNTDFYFAF